MTKDEYKQILRGAVEHVRRQVAQNVAEVVAMQINVRYEVRPDNVLVPIIPEMEAPGMERVRAYMAERLSQLSEHAIAEAFALPEECLRPEIRSSSAVEVRLDHFLESDSETGALSWKAKLNQRPLREQRFDDLRAEGKKLGEINAILEAEGYSEVSGEGVMPCPTKSHEIVRENKGAKRMIEGMP